MKMKVTMLVQIRIKVAATHFLFHIKMMLAKRVLFLKVELEVSTINLSLILEVYLHQAFVLVTSRH